MVISINNIDVDLKGLYPITLKSCIPQYGFISSNIEVSFGARNLESRLEEIEAYSSSCLSTFEDSEES